MSLDNISNEQVDMFEIHPIPRFAMGIGIGACAALALKCSIPGGMLFGLANKVGTYVAGFFFDAIRNYVDPSEWSDLAPFLAFKSIKYLTAGLGAAFILSTPELMIMSVAFIAVDTISWFFFNDFWTI